MLKIYFLIIAVFFSLVATPSSSKELQFLFTEDQNIKTDDIDDFGEKIASKKDISNSNWFSSPPTRLELFTYTLNQYVKKEFEDYWEYYSKEVYKFFEKRKSEHELVRADAQAFFSNKEDVFVCSVNIAGLGKPKKPMKDFCDEIIAHVSFWLHGEGYFFQNTILRPFIFGSYDDPEVLRTVELLKRNLIILVTLESSYGNEENGVPRNFYIFRGYRSLHEGKTYYSKGSFTINR